MAQDILLLKLLTIPVIVIKFVSKIISILTYLPNYFFILVMDQIVFMKFLQSSLLLYSISWPIRLIALNLVTALFCSQFYAIYHFLDIYQKSLIIQILAMSLALGGLLFLMRKGYLQMIQKFDPIKLKSPIEHIIVYYQFLKDITGIFLALINILLIKNSLKTLSYNYVFNDIQKHQNHSNPFLQHIKKLIHESLIYDLTFFYTKIFFKIFPWRYQYSIQFVQKQKNNILNLLVLLTLLFLQTLLDIICLAVFGLFCIAHWKRNVFKKRLISQQRKYRVALQHFGFIILQFLQISVTFLCIFINLRPTITHLRTLLELKQGEGESQQFTPVKFMKQTVEHCLHSLAKFPAYFSLIMIFIFRYKYHKLQLQIIKLESGASPVSDWTKDKLYMQMYAEQVIDAWYIPLIILNTINRPFNYKWLTLLINQNYDLQRQIIQKYFFKCFYDMIAWLPLSFTMTSIMIFYCPKHIFTLIKGYYIMRKNLSLQQSLTSESIYKKYALGLKTKFVNDLPHLPLYFLMKICLFKLFDKDLSPQKSYPVFQKIIKMFYIHRVKSSIRSQTYFDMFNKDLASGLIQDQGHKMRFWKYAYKCQRYITITKILQLFVIKKRYVYKLQKLQKPSNFSAISNEFWYRYSITCLMWKILAFWILEIIVSLVGFLVLLPLTLWRLPTFILVYKIEKSKKNFFPILLQIYKLMGFDILMILPNILAFILSPICFSLFRMKTMFKYGVKGHKQLLNIQGKKAQYILQVLIVRTFKVYRLMLQIIFIFILYLRKLVYLNEIKKKGISLSILKQYLFKRVEVPQFNDLIQAEYQFQNINFGQLAKVTNQYFVLTCGDIPYLLVSLFIMIVMPWRYFYLKNAIKAMKQDKYQRHQVLKVLKNVFKDYLCIFMNIILLFSLVKTRKAIQLIKRNYRLNFFVGFLKYSFMKQLFYEIKQAARIYYGVVLIISCFIFDFQNCKEIFNRLYQYYKSIKQEEQVKKQNQKIYDNTIKQKKDLKILDRMGFNEYVTLCQFLTVKQLAVLSRVNKLNYMILQRQQIWIQKWQTNYTSKYQQQIKGQTYKDRCIKAFQKQKYNIKSNKLTYNQIVYQMFLYHVYQTQTNIPNLLKSHLSAKITQKIYRNYQWSTVQGYGPRNQLPQQQNQDQEFLRLTNQVRRPKIQYRTQFEFYFDHLLVRPIEFIAQTLDSFYRVDSYRRLKQLSFVALIFVFNWLLLFKLAWNYLWNIFIPSRWIGVHIICSIYFGIFLVTLVTRLRVLYFTSWISLRPLNLIYDIVDGVKAVIQFIRIKFLLFVNWFNLKVYSPVKVKTTQIIRTVLNFMKKIVNYVYNKIKYASKAFVDKVASPLYIYCVNKLIAVKKVFVMLFVATKKTIVFIINSIKKMVLSFYQLISAILNNLNNIYYNILLYSRRVMLKFGIIGELVFTIQGLIIMTLPSIFCYFIYNQRWYIIVSTVHTAILMVLGYKHLNKIKTAVN